MRTDEALTAVREFVWDKKDGTKGSVMLRPFTVRQTRAFWGRWLNVYKASGVEGVAAAMGEIFCFAYGPMTARFNARDGEHFKAGDVDELDNDALNRLAEIGLELNPDLLTAEGDAIPLEDEHPSSASSPSSLDTDTDPNTSSTGIPPA